MQDSSYDSAGSIIEGFREESRILRKIFIPLYDFQDAAVLFPDVDNGVGVLKIDVEGAEHEVIEVMAHMINKLRPIIIMEMLPPYDTDSFRFKKQNNIFEKLSGMKYSICRIIKKTSGEVFYEQLATYESHSNFLEWSDYLCIPKEKMGLFAVN